MVFNAPSGDERSRLNSNVLPSGRLRRETKSIALHFTLMSRRDCAFRVAVGNESKRTRVGTCSLNFADGVCKIFEEIPAAKSGSLCPRAHASPLFKRSELWWRRRQECGRLELKYLPQKSSQFCRQPISKSVIIGDVPIAIREGEGRGNSNRADRGRCQKSFIFQRLIDRFNCLCYERVNKVRASKRAILSSSMAEHSAVNRRVVSASPARGCELNSGAFERSPTIK